MKNFEIKTKDSEVELPVNIGEYLFIKIDNLNIQLKLEEEGFVLDVFNKNEEEVLSRWFLYDEDEDDWDDELN